MSGARRSTRQPPVSEPAASPGIDLDGALRNVLEKRSLGDMPRRYVVLVEGTTDIEYLNAAVEVIKSRCSCDLLDLGNGAQIAIHTPLKPGTTRGGIDELVPLADELRTFVITLEAVGPMCIVLDHDEAGKSAYRKIQDYGYCVPRSMAILLDPKEHPSACDTLKGHKVVCVEDLLSVGIQKKYFDDRSPSCEVSFRDGVPVKYVWHRPSKDELPEFVRTNAEPQDLCELVRLIVRIRKLWSLEIPEAVEELLQSHDAGVVE